MNSWKNLNGKMFWCISLIRNLNGYSGQILWIKQERHRKNNLSEEYLQLLEKISTLILMRINLFGIYDWKCQRYRSYGARLKRHHLSSTKDFRSDGSSLLQKKTSATYGSSLINLLKSAPSRKLCSSGNQRKKYPKAPAGRPSWRKSKLRNPT